MTHSRSTGNPIPTQTDTTHDAAGRRPRRPPMIALSLIAAGALALAACGGGGDDDSGIASIDGSTEGDDEVVDPDLALADYQQCLRDNGLDLQVQAGGGSISIGGAGGEADPQSGGFDPDALREAADACRDLGQEAMGAFTPDPQQQAAIEDAQLRFEECMADKGLAGYTGGAMASSGIGIDGSNGATDPQSGGSLDEVDPDVLNEALDECRTAFDELEQS